MMLSPPVPTGLSGFSVEEVTRLPDHDWERTYRSRLAARMAVHVRTIAKQAKLVRVCDYR